MKSFVLNLPRYLFFTGKGGVDKTSMACATALGLAEQGERVLLISTDPASNLDEVLETPLSSQPTPIAHVTNLFALNIDPIIAAAEYRERMVGPYRGVLLEATQSYHREVAKSVDELPEAVKALLPRVRDPEFTKVLIVSLPEATPTHEASALQDDLRRAGIEPYGWIINQSFAFSGTQDPVLCAKSREELSYIDEILDRPKQDAFPMLCGPWGFMWPLRQQTAQQTTQKTAQKTAH